MDMNLQEKPRSIRILATDEQWKRLKGIALDNDQELQDFFTAAIQTSPLAKRAFLKSNGSGATSPEANARAATKGA